MGAVSVAIAVVSDIAIIGFTLVKTLGIYRIHQQLGLHRVSVTHILVRNGKYYEISTTCNVTNSVCLQVLYILGIVVVRLNPNPLIDTASTSILLVLNITTILTDVFAVGRSSAVSANHNQFYAEFTKYVDRMLLRYQHSFTFEMCKFNNRTMQL